MASRSHTAPSPATLLVVEDEAELSRLFVEVLETAGYQVVTADSVTDALITLSGQHFDAAVLDIELRDGLVFPVADRLADAGTPFVFASAVYLQMVPRQHQDAAFVAKPFNINDLLARVEEAVAAAGQAPKARPRTTETPVPRPARHR